MTEEMRENHAEVEIDPELLDAPSERDRVIYEAICIDCRPAPEVAAELGLATTTVRNVALDVQRKMARRLHRIEKLTTAESLKSYYDRLERQLGQVNGAWAASRRDREVVQKLKNKEGEERDRTCLMKQAGDSRLMNLAMKISREMHLIEAQFRALKEKEARKAERDQIPADERRAQRIIRNAEELNLSQQVRRSGSTGGLVVSRPEPQPDSRPDSRPQAEAEDEAWEDEGEDWKEENEAGHGDEEQRDPRLDPEALLRWVERVLDGDKKASQTLRASDAPQRAAGQGVAPREVGVLGPGGG